MLPRDSVLLALPVVIIGVTAWGVQRRNEQAEREQVAAQQAREKQDAAEAKLQAAEEKKRLAAEATFQAAEAKRLDALAKQQAPGKPRDLKAPGPKWGRVRWLQWSPDGRSLAAEAIPDSSPEMRIWDVPSGVLKIQAPRVPSSDFNEHGGSGQFSRDGLLFGFLSGDQDGLATCLYDVRSGRKLPSVSQRPLFGFLPGGRVASGALPYGPSASHSPKATLTDARTGQEVDSIEPEVPEEWREVASDSFVHFYPATQYGPSGNWGYYFLADERESVSESSKGNLVIFNVRKPSLMHVIRHTGGAHPSRDGRLLAVEIRSPETVVTQSIQLWDMDSGRLRTVCKMPKPLLPMPPIFSGDNSKMLLFNDRFRTSYANSSSYGQRTRKIEMWDTHTGHILWERTESTKPEPYRSNRGAEGIRMSPDASLFAVADWRTIFLHDARSGRRLYTLTGHGGEVLDLAFSPDGKTLASAANDGTVKLWPLRK